MLAPGGIGAVPVGAFRVGGPAGVCGMVSSTPGAGEVVFTGFRRVGVEGPYRFLARLYTILTL